MTKKPAFQSVIDALLEAKTPFPARYLHTFSDIDPDSLRLLQKAWPKVDLKRKQTLLEDLKDLAETDTLTNFDTLAQALLDDPNVEVRVLATLLLWECEERKLIPIFIKALKTDESAEVRAASATALGLFVYLGELEEIPAEMHHKVEEALLEAAKSEESSLVRRRALESLGASSRPEVPALIEEAVHQKNPEWVASALLAMGRSSDEQWEKHILSRLRNPNDDIRWEAIEAAGELGLPTARQALLDLLEDEEDLEVRRQAITALSKIGGEGVRATLEELLEMEEDEEEIEFLEESLANLIFAEETGIFEMFGFEPDEELHEEKE